MDACWRAANYLSVGQIFLFDNPLLKRPLALADVKRMLLGHWSARPGDDRRSPCLSVRYAPGGSFLASTPGHFLRAVKHQAASSGAVTGRLPHSWALSTAAGR